jgi:protein tyrosine phosphatase
VDGFKQRRAFIATQHPLASTLFDFWQMVWDQEVHSIVMLTQLDGQGQQPPEAYWPNRNQGTLTFGLVSVKLEVEQHLGFATERRFAVSCKGCSESRVVMQWQFPSWPTGEVVGSGRDMVDMIERMEVYARSKVVMPQEESVYGNQETITEQAILKQLRPTVVHCTGGAGRTGAFCAAVICLQRMKEENRMDLFQLTKHLRTQRPSMIQTADQYAYVYRVVLDWLDTRIRGSAVLDLRSIYATPLQNVEASSA